MGAALASAGGSADLFKFIRELFKIEYVQSTCILNLRLLSEFGVLIDHHNGS